ncbi:MAG TPA: tRNA(fMet)-specific endonuclease VapC [Sphingomicrobium sp.]|jgi:tRNA(fMet)-specific endonuclease VapC|nr:tRNA(fMet)-specific endonuclease VapC [Sphingomicrobium sp.]
MLKYLLDTNLCIRVLRDRPQGLRERFNADASSLSISSIILYELLFGAAKSARPVENRHAVEAFSARLGVLDFDADAAAHAGEIRADLERRGTPIGGYDVLIAGHARSRGLVVVTGNLAEFRRVEGLRCEDWEVQN